MCIRDRRRVLPAFSLRAVPGQWRVLWFDITLDETLTLPEYPLVLHVFGADGALLARHSLTVGVVPAALPPQALIHTQWFHGDCLADYYGVEVFSERHWAIMENFIREAAEHGINMLLTPLFTPPLDTGEGMERTTIQLVDVHCGQGVYSFDFSRLARFVDMAERCGIRYFETVSYTHLARMNNVHCVDISAQTYKPNCPPVALTKLPLIVTESMAD